MGLDLGWLRLFGGFVTVPAHMSHVPRTSLARLGDSPEVTSGVCGETVAMSTATTTTATTALQSRARWLRSEAASLHPLLAEAYRRRAAELDVQAWLEVVWDSPIDLRDVPPTEKTEDTVTVSDSRQPHAAVA